ncbi:MAG: DUF4139 domain-containing protein [Acidobacteria bacterium]|nr:DUF4139 domain-containing protein [Acidobacteriota bacterium]
MFSSVKLTTAGCLAAVLVGADPVFVASGFSRKIFRRASAQSTEFDPGRVDRQKAEATSSSPDTTSPGSDTQDVTTLDDQTDLSVTVYNSDIALVRDVREVKLPEGTFDLRFMDIAATVNPATVHFRSLTEPPRLGVLEQNYEYDLLEPDKLLKKYVGREITLARWRQENGTSKLEELKATLIALNNNGPIWKIGTEIVTGLHADHYRFPELPDNLYSRPTLIWTLANRGSSRHRVEASYLAGNLAWNADYVLTVSREHDKGDLDGWVTLRNTSGTAFKKARLQLVAGDLNRVRQTVVGKREAFDRAMAAAAPEAAFAQEAFSEYHLYTLGRRTSIGHNETKQINLLSGTGVPVRKVFVVEGRSFYYRNQQHPGSPLRDVVQTYYKFRNDERSNLGMPMPAGIVRVYQADSTGGVQFAGEDRIAHTPKDEELSLHIGNAFDVVCERKQTDYLRVGEGSYELAFEVTLRNHKDTPISVEVNEPIGGSWRMISASHRWEKTDAWAARFTVPVAANGTAVLTYRVRARW